MKEVPLLSETFKRQTVLPYLFQIGRNEYIYASQKEHPLRMNVEPPEYRSAPLLPPLHSDLQLTQTTPNISMRYAVNRIPVPFGMLSVLNRASIIASI
jgi:hypothetical protein